MVNSSSISTASRDFAAEFAFVTAMIGIDLSRIGDGEAQYALLTNERGGIVDDQIGRAHV